MRKKSRIDCRRSAPAKPRLGPKDQAERYRVSARYRSGTKLAALWLAMLTLKRFTVPQLAALGTMNRGYVKTYIRILWRAGYLDRSEAGNPHKPAVYSIGPHYRGKMAPQMAGGAGSGGHLSHGWKTLKRKR
jgi:hypothetical protein